MSHQRRMHTMMPLGLFARIHARVEKSELLLLKHKREEGCNHLNIRVRNDAVGAAQVQFYEEHGDIVKDPRGLRRYLPEHPPFAALAVNLEHAQSTVTQMFHSHRLERHEFVGQPSIFASTERLLVVTLLIP